MSKKAIFLTSFGSDVEDLKSKDRTASNVVMALKNNPRISTFTMSENKWLCNIIENLEAKEIIVPLEEPYPWLRWKVLEH